ncbi:hypothetical protein U1Q18_029771 [Sarracenia purpurea var. burkii]
MRSTGKWKSSPARAEGAFPPAIAVVEMNERAGDDDRELLLIFRIFSHFRSAVLRLGLDLQPGPTWAIVHLNRGSAMYCASSPGFAPVVLRSVTTGIRLGMADFSGSTSSVVPLRFDYLSS